MTTNSNALIITRENVADGDNFDIYIKQVKAHINEVWDRQLRIALDKMEVESKKFQDYMNLWAAKMELRDKTRAGAV